MAKRQVAALLALAGLTGCTPAPPAGPSAARAPHYRAGQPWTAPPAWTLTVTGARCGPAPDQAPAESDVAEPDVADVCRVAITAANGSDRTEPIGGTDDQPGPLWRLVGYDADSHEFHGHGGTEPTIPPGAAATTEVVFEVPAGRHLRRVLVGNAMVDLAPG